MTNVEWKILLPTQRVLVKALLQEVSQKETMMKYLVESEAETDTVIHQAREIFLAQERLVLVVEESCSLNTRWFFIIASILAGLIAIMGKQHSQVLFFFKGLNVGSFLMLLYTQIQWWGKRKGMRTTFHARQQEFLKERIGKIAA
ncbi:hypothetical protein [Geotalea sp. SG265]|uniref:hypothetical protein n=1 Tax=Geotalea sp. SG265 TaxID=2922867 RepID=UPI001FAEBB92|nr:hypothetical protein [Geotalea sp. SG265]